MHNKTKRPFLSTGHKGMASVSLCLILLALLFGNVLNAGDDITQDLFKPFKSNKIHPEDSPYIVDFTLNNSYEAYGPLAYKQKEANLERFGVPPFYTIERNKGADSVEVDSFYPVFGGSRHGEEYRTYLLQILNWAGGQDDQDELTRRFTIFPLYFRQHSPNPKDNYWAILPFYGNIKRRMWREEMQFYMMPLYIKTLRKGVITKNYVAPIFHVRNGNGVKGWQFWPIVGMENKEITTITNNWGEEIMVPGHKNEFYVWPIVLHKKSDIGTDNPSEFTGVIPFYAQTRSPNRDHSVVLWPFFNWVDDREQQYKEWGLPYPFINFARGEGKTADRIFPFFSYVDKKGSESDFILWPAWKRKYNETESTTYERERLLFYLYSDVETHVKDTNEVARRTDAFPLFTATESKDGTYRVQMLSLFEPFFHENVSIQRNWSPVCAIWALEENKNNNFLKEAILWNFYRHEVVEKQKKWSGFFGMFQFIRDEEYGNYWRVFWAPDKRKAKEAEKAKANEVEEETGNIGESDTTGEVSVLPTDTPTQE